MTTAAASPETRGDPAAQPQTLWAQLSAVAARYPAKRALLFVDDEGRESGQTYRELLDAAAQLSAGLARIGVRRGDRVALLATSRLEWVHSCFAAMRLGAVLVPVNTRLVAQEIRYILAQSRARHLIMIDRFRSIDFVDRLREIAPDLDAASPGRLHLAALPELRTMTVAVRDGDGLAHPACYAYADLHTAEATVPARALAETMQSEASPDDLGMIKYTSGSTGFPKGAMLDQAGIVRTALAITERIEAGPDQTWFTAMPFFHVGGSVWSLLTALLRGAGLVFTESHEPLRTLRLVERERCTIVYGVPAMIRDLLAELRTASFDLSSVWMISATTQALIDEAQQRIPSVTTGLNAFGSTETFGPFSVISPRDDQTKRRTTMGRPLPGNTIRVIDPDTGGEQPPGSPGEGLLRGVIMRGYWDAPAGASGVDEDGWFHSGDIVTVDRDGYVTWLGRYKAMLKVGGENIAAEEVENTIIEHDAVLDAIVVPVPDVRLDQIARAYVIRHADATITGEELRHWLVGRLAPFKIPRQVEFVPDFPRTGSGKIDRARMIDIAADMSSST